MDFTKLATKAAAGKSDKPTVKATVTETEDAYCLVIPKRMPVSAIREGKGKTEDDGTVIPGSSYFVVLPELLDEHGNPKRTVGIEVYNDNDHAQVLSTKVRIGALNQFLSIPKA
jgi:hypothetical protein